MNKLWMYIEHKCWTKKAKYSFAFLLYSTLFVLAGLGLWLLIRPWALSGIDWMLCFIGYPLIISWLTIYYNFCNKAFT